MRRIHSPLCPEKLRLGYFQTSRLDEVRSPLLWLTKQAGQRADGAGCAGCADSARYAAPAAVGVASWLPDLLFVGRAACSCCGATRERHNHLKRNLDPGNTHVCGAWPTRCRPRDVRARGGFA